MGLCQSNDSAAFPNEQPQQEQEQRQFDNDENDNDKEGMQQNDGNHKKMKRDTTASARGVSATPGQEVCPSSQYCALL